MTVIRLQFRVPRDLISSAVGQREMVTARGAKPQIEMGYLVVVLVDAGPKVGAVTAFITSIPSGGIVSDNDCG